MGIPKIRGERMKFLIKEIRYPDGTIEKIKVPISKINKDISKLVKDNREMFDILEKL